MPEMSEGATSRVWHRGLRVRSGAEATGTHTVWKIFILRTWPEMWLPLFFRAAPTSGGGGECSSRES